MHKLFRKPFFISLVIITITSVVLSLNANSISDISQINTRSAFGPLISEDDSGSWSSENFTFKDSLDAVNYALSGYEFLQRQYKA